MQVSMHSFTGIAARCLLAGVLSAPLLAQTTVRHVKVLDSKEAVEIEVEASDRVVPETRVLTGPDRLVVDFPNALPGRELRSQSVNRGEVKDVRVGLFQAKPPVTRLVLDLRSAQSYQVFPYGRTVIIKVSGGAGNPAGVSEVRRETPAQQGPATANSADGKENHPPAAPAQPTLEVSFRDGLLTINANRASLSEVLLAVQRGTGADISIAAGAEQEKVVANLGPAPAPEVLAQLLNGSSFNFLIVSAASDPGQLDRVILSPRSQGLVSPPPSATSSNEAEEDQAVPPAAAQNQPDNRQPRPMDVPHRPSQPEIPPGSGDPPEQ